MSYIRKAFEYEQTLDPLGTQGWVGSAGTLHTFIVLPAELPNTGLHVSTLVTSEQELPDTLTWEEKGTACPPGAWREASAPRLHSWSGWSRHLELSRGPEAVSLSTGETLSLEVESDRGA